MAASSLSPSFAYTAATALPEPHSRTQYGCVPASRSYSARSGGCFPKTGSSKSLPPSRPTLPHPVNASASSSSGPRGAGSGCISSHQPYASGVATAMGGSARATSAGAAGGAGGRESRSRSGKRRVGEEGRFRGAPDHLKKKNMHYEHLLPELTDLDKHNNVQKVRHVRIARHTARTMQWRVRPTVRRHADNAS